jgi:hypothetical protein
MRSLVAAALLAGACAASNQARRADALLIVDAKVAEASVYVDERFAGRVAELSRSGVRVPSGALRVEVRADGYFPAYRDVRVQKGERARVTVELRPVPEGE